MRISPLPYSARKVVKFVSERAAMKRRVRGLLHRKWLAPFGALALAALPMVAAIALVVLLLPSLGGGFQSLRDQLAATFADTPQLYQMLVTLMFGLELDFSQMTQSIPGFAILLGVYVLIAAPISVSVSGYFLALLRGKNPGIKSVFDCFSGKYLKYLGGMLYKLLWIIVWAVMAFVGTVVLYNGGRFLIEHFAEQLSTSQVTVYGILIVVTLVWFVVFTMLLINRFLAYAFTPVCIAAQPRLPAHRAVRLSRKLMRGCKWRLVGLYMSFLVYYLPAIIALVGIVVLPYLAPLVSISEILVKSIRTFLFIIAAANLLVTVFVAPYAASAFRAFYIERKREALMDEEVTPDDFASAAIKEKHAEQPQP